MSAEKLPTEFDLEVQTSVKTPLSTKTFIARLFAAGVLRFFGRSQNYRLTPRRTLSISGVNNADGTGTLTVQLQDLDGNDVAEVAWLEIGFGATAIAAFSDLGTVTATSGVVRGSHVADGHLAVTTTSAGLAVLTLAAIDEWFFTAQVDGLVVAGSLTVT